MLPLSHQEATAKGIGSGTGTGKVEAEQRYGPPGARAEAGWPASDLQGRGVIGVLSDGRQHSPHSVRGPTAVACPAQWSTAQHSTGPNRQGRGVAWLPAPPPTPRLAPPKVERNKREPGRRAFLQALLLAHQHIPKTVHDVAAPPGERAAPLSLWTCRVPPWCDTACCR